MLKTMRRNVVVSILLAACVQIVAAENENTQTTTPTAILNSDKPKVLSLQDAVTEVLNANPGLAMMQARVHALAAIPEQKGSLPDPKLVLNAMSLPVDSFELQQEPMTQLQVGFSQMLPYPGKLALRESIAEYQTLSADWDQAEMRLKMVSRVKIIWWNIYYLDRALLLIERNKQLMRQLIDVARTKYKVGNGLQQDVLLAQLELSKLEDKAIVLRGKRANQAARINALLNRQMNVAVVITSTPVGRLQDLGDSPDLQKLALQTRPFLSQKQTVIDASQARLRLAKKNYYPDFKLAAIYGFRNGNNRDGSNRSDFVSVMLSMNLPLFTASRQDKAVDQRSNQLLQAQYGYQDAIGKVAKQVAMALADYRQARQQALLLKTGIIPQANQTVSSMLAAYQVSKVDFLSLVRVQITLFNYEIRYWKALSQGNQALARLTAATGKLS